MQKSPEFNFQMPLCSTNNTNIIEANYMLTEGDSFLYLSFSPVSLVNNAINVIETYFPLHLLSAFPLPIHVIISDIIFLSTISKLRDNLTGHKLWIYILGIKWEYYANSDVLNLSGGIVSNKMYSFSKDGMYIYVDWTGVFLYLGIYVFVHTYTYMSIMAINENRVHGIEREQARGWRKGGGDDRITLFYQN